MAEKLFVGPKVRRLREERGWTLEICAARLNLSTSYLSQIETNQRPVSARVLIGLMRVFDTDAAAFDADDEGRLLADLREAVADGLLGEAAPSLSELRQAVVHAPTLAREHLALHRAFRRLGERLKTVEETVALDETAAASALLPYEEVRDFFHYKNNYVHALDVAAETLAGEIGVADAASLEGALEGALTKSCGVRTLRLPGGEGASLRAYDANTRAVTIDASATASSRAFQLAYQLAALTLDDLIEKELAAAGFRSDAARDVCRVGLSNYAAGALMLPYRRFREAAQEMRHDIERLETRFQASLEQVCHRLSTLQRPGERGTPFYFVRVDPAGNITKRHSAARFQFARFGGACPLWNVHEAFADPDRFLVQVAEMPDGQRYLCVARAVVKRAGSYLEPDRRYALGFGCEVEHADQVVYAEGLDLDGPPARIGVSCRICERNDCAQRAFPPVDRPLKVPRDRRTVVPYELE